MTVPSEEQKLRWMSQIAQVTGKMRDNGFPAGSSASVAFSRENQVKYNIHELGRVKLVEGGVEFRAGPVLTPSPLKYEIPPSIDWSLESDYLQGKPVNLEKLCAPVRGPISLFSEGVTKKSFAFEKSMFEMVSTFQKRVVLVNPSWVSLSSAKFLKPKVLLTDPRFTEKVRSQLRELDRTWANADDTFTDEVEDGEIAYLGMTPCPRSFPHAWRLIPNPYYDQQLVKDHVVRETALGIYIDYVKKNRMVSSFWRTFFSGFVYTPATLEKAFDCGQQYILESSFAFPLKDVEVDLTPHTPKFLPSLPPYVQGHDVMGEVFVSALPTGKVVDVKGGGTYFSRRARYQNFFPDVEWEPFCEYGTVAVHRFTNVVTERFSESYYLSDSSKVAIHCDKKVQVIQGSILGKERSGILYQKNVEGSYVLPGYPKGYLMRVPVSEHSGTYVVTIPEIEGLWHLYPTDSCFRKFQVGGMVMLNDFQTFLHYRDIDATYQGRSEVKLDMKILTFLGEHSLNDPSSGIPFSDIQGFAQIKGPVEKFLSRIRVPWKESRALYFFALPDDIRFSGTVVLSPGQYTFNGRSWKEVYERLLTSSEDVSAYCNYHQEVQDFFSWLGPCGIYHKWKDHISAAFTVMAVQKF